MGEGGGVGEIKLEYTPTWIVAVVCSVIVFISLVVERLLHFLGKLLKRKNQKPLFEALQKVKEELMLLGFISLLLVVFQGLIQRICIPQSFTRYMLPCNKEDGSSGAVAGGRRLLSSGGSDSDSDYCAREGKVPLLSVEAIHELHIFIFVLAATHVTLSALTMLLSGAKIRQWKHWEDSIPKDDTRNVQGIVTHFHQSEFMKAHFLGIGKDSMILSWLQSFVKQFYGSVTKSDYTTMRLGFIMAHCKGNPKFDFYKYMVRALEADFKKVVGIRWYLWIFLVIFLLLNIQEWHAYFWIAFIRLILLLVVGTKLEHVITQLANEVAEKHSVIEGELIVIPSDSHFWFHRPRIILYVIHFILFLNAFEIAFFFWILVAYGFISCIMGQVEFIIPRLIICVIIQLLCSYSTLPLYAICTQMGSSFKRAVFDEQVQEGLVRWHRKVKDRVGQRATDGGQSPSNTMESANGSTPEIQLQTLNLVVQKDSFKEEEKSLMEKPKDLDE